MRDIVFALFDIVFVEVTKLITIYNPKLRNRILYNLKLKKLRKLCTHAYHNSPYYQKIFKEHGIKEEDLKTITFEQCPVIKKQHVIENVHDIVTDRTLDMEDLKRFVHDSSEKKTYKNKYTCFTTSGSLGIKLPVLFSNSDWKRIILHISFYASKPYKILFGKKTRAAIIGLVEGRSAGVTCFRNLSNLIFDKKELSLLWPLEKIVEELNSFNPEQLVSYPGVFTSLVQYKREGILKIKPKKIFLSGEVLTEENRKIIQEVFNCPVINSYGASECLVMGTKISSAPYKLFPNICHIEILGDDNKPAPAGKLGRIVITNFFNYTQPFIRYEIGDSAIQSLNEIGELSFNGIEGRSYKPIHFSNNEGKKVELFAGTFYSPFLYIAGIYKSQMLIGENCFKVIIVGANECIEECKKYFSELLTNLNIDKSVNFKVEQVKDIQPELNGKIPFIKYKESLTLTN